MRALVLVAFTGAGGCGSFRTCDEVDTSGVKALPTLLSLTGLYFDAATSELSPDAIAYEPRFERWSDGAEKLRWLLLPDGLTIEVGPPNSWVFPEGTRLFKEFTRDDVRSALSAGVRHGVEARRARTRADRSFDARPWGAGTRTRAAQVRERSRRAARSARDAAPGRLATSPRVAVRATRRRAPGAPHRDQQQERVHPPSHRGV